MKQQSGSAVLLVLLLVGLGGVLIPPTLQLSSTVLKGRASYSQDIMEDYAADAAIEYALWRVMYEPGFASSLPIGEASTAFAVDLNGYVATASVLTEATAGEMSGQPLAGPAQGDIFFKVTKQVFASASYQSIAFDGFESGNSSGGTGPWAGNWTLSGDYSFNTSGEYQGTYHLRLRNNNGYAERVVNLTGYPTAFFRFWANVSSFESGDTAAVKVSTNGSDWDTLKTFTEADDGLGYQLYQFDVSSYGEPSIFYIAFDADMSSEYDSVYFDNVEFTNVSAPTVLPDVLTEYTYSVSIQCMDPNGCNTWDRDLERIVDNLPDRNASSGDYLQYIAGSTTWDEGDWGIPAFDPTNVQIRDSGAQLNQEIEWDFTDAGYSDVNFEYSEVKTFTFRAMAAMQEGVYCNRIYVRPGDSGFREGNTAKITVGNPPDTRCSGGLLQVNKTSDTPVIYPNEETTITYTVTIENVDTMPIEIDRIEDYLPTTGVASPTFEYVDNSTTATITSFGGIAFDGFESGDGNGGSGAWLGNWTLSGDNSPSDTSGEYSGNYHLRLRSSTGFAQRSVDLTGHPTAYLQFWAKLNSFESSETAEVRVSTDGSNWDVLKTWVDGEDDNIYRLYQYDLSSYGAPATFYLAFDANMNSDQDYFYIDSIRYVDADDVDTPFIDRPSYPVLFYDGFSRPDSNIVDYWTDGDGTGSDCRIVSEYAALDSQCAITQSNISTANYTDILLTYDWQGYHSIAFDGFESGDGMGGTGAWTGNWTLSGDNSPNNSSGQHSGNYHLRLRQSSGYAKRAVDVTGYSAVTLDFWARLNSFESDDEAVVLVSTNGSTWDVLKTWVNGEDDDNYHEYQYDLSGYLPTSTLYVAFDANMSSDQDYFYIDDVRFIDPALLTLTVEWKPSASGTWNMLAQHALGSAAWQQASYALPPEADNTTIDIRFTGPNSADEAGLDRIKVTTVYSASTDTIPVCMPDQNEGADFLAKTWYSTQMRWELEWDFDRYPLADDAVWDPEGVCQGYEWGNYNPLTLQPGEVFTITFQSRVTLTASGSYYNEVLVRFQGDINGVEWGYSWPAGGISVPQYDLMAETLNSILRSNARLTGNGIRQHSYHWRRHR